MARASLVIAMMSAIAGCSVQDHLLYFPDKSRPDPARVGVAELREVSFETADGVALRSWWLPSRAGQPAIAYFHGNGGNVGHRAECLRRFASAGLGVLMVEYRGYGGNPGRPSEEGLYADARAALDFLERNGVARDRVVLYGESLGSGVAVRMASERPPGALILEAPYTSLFEAAIEHYPAWLVRLIQRDRYDSLSLIGTIRAPLLVLQGERDEVIPVALGRKLFAAGNQPKEAWFAPSGHHNDLREHGALEVAIGFIGRTLR
jgi:fermentation-respiration switch protein FrsA (DUF1100 family)